jgi:hypothetical protein
MQTYKQFRPAAHESERKAEAADHAYDTWKDEQLEDRYTTDENESEMQS